MPVTVRSYNHADEDAVVELWQSCELVVPQNDPRRDISAKLAFQPELFLVMESGARIVGSVMAGYEGHRGWINYLAVAPDLQGQGLARALMDEAENRLRALGCQKINLQVRRSNASAVAFYERVGFKPDDVIPLGKRLR